MSVTGGGGTHRGRRAFDAAGFVIAGGLIALLLWFRGFNARVQESPLGVNQSGDISVYFTHPQGLPSEAAAPAEALARAVNDAAQSIDMAAYELDLAPLADALLAAADRGVAVRIVAESDQAGSGRLPQLERSGIPIVFDGRPSLMHDKFLVIDHAVVWTGSMNFTQNGVFNNDNNLVRVESAQAADLYTQEFEEMFVQDRFSALSLSGSNRLPINLSGGQLEIYFSPDDHPAEAVVAAVASARRRVEFLAFTFTAAEIAGAMVERAQAGIPVRGVFEADQANSLGSQYAALREAGVDVRLDGNPGLLHDKIIIVDGAIVITGSYNFSLSAETTNDENLIVIRSDEVGRWYEQEFDRLFANALP